MMEAAINKNQYSQKENKKGRKQELKSSLNGSSNNQGQYPDDARASVFIPRNIKPCEFCGARPRERKLKLPNGRIISVYPYPCNCYELAEERRLPEDRFRDALAFSRIPPRYQSASLDTAAVMPGSKDGRGTGGKYAVDILPQLRRYMKEYHAARLDDKPARGLGLIGDVGTGKTHYVCAILLDLIRHGVKSIFLSVPDFFKELKSAFKYESQYDDLLRLAEETPAVAFDDIGAEYHTQWTVDELGVIINYRYNHNLPTFFTTNLRTVELAERIGTRTADRLRDMCRAYLIEGPSLRGSSRGKKGAPEGA